MRAVLTFMVRRFGVKGTMSIIVVEILFVSLILLVFALAALGQLGK